MGGKKPRSLGSLYVHFPQHGVVEEIVDAKFLESDPMFSLCFEMPQTAIKRFVGNSLLVTMDLDGCFRLNRNAVLKEIANSTLQKKK